MWGMRTSLCLALRHAHMHLHASPMTISPASANGWSCQSNVGSTWEVREPTYGDKAWWEHVCIKSQSTLTKYERGTEEVANA